MAEYLEDSIVQVISYEEKNENNYKCIVKILNGKYKNKKIIAYLKVEKKIKCGYILRISGSVERAQEKRNIGGFNYRNYLKQYKIYGICYAENSEYIKIKKDFYYIIGNVRDILKSRLDKMYESENSEFLKKILFGFDSDISDETKKIFRTAGVSHVLAISGLHVSYIILVLKKIFDKLISNFKIKNLLMGVVLLFFLILTDFLPSCTRACVCYSLLLLSQVLLKRNSIIRNLLIVFCAICYSNIYNLYNLGLWFSFLATLSIILYSNFFKICFKKFPFEKIKNIIITSFSAQVLILPIMLYSFNTFSTFFILSNIIVSYVIGIIIILGYISLFIPGVYLIEEILINNFVKLIDFCSKIPFSNLYVRSFGIGKLIVSYVLILIVTYFFGMKKIKSLKIFFIKKFCKKAVCVILIVCVCFNLNINFTNNLNLYFLDVSQGDSTIIKYKSKCILIDGGNNDGYDYGENVIFNHLLKIGVKQVDYLICSHFDSDHVGGLFYIIKNMNVKNVIIGKQFEENSNLQDFLKEISKRKINLKVLKNGDNVKIDKNLNIDVLWPDDNSVINENKINNNALVLMVRFNNFKILFTGDIEEEAEKKIVNLYGEKLKCDILKVAHHGSKSSTSTEFLINASPQIALIGVSKDNNYGHPSQSVIDKLICNDVKIYRTDVNGEIIINILKNIKVKKFIKN